ncbi:single-stranded DNA-binding protein [Flammeovirgaceae bacterium SG7u.111]|nr:single-stranded DNA-binding protein [Flammeovirgaceae bacterium SG7u.132]WPO35442.1 single-stranded DNA-binding protein [Flammeovirgaceae bacterium SG7u.111]
MAGVNKVILLGNLGQDPEVRYFEGENTNAVARITLATTESYKDREGKRVDSTEWHDVEMWGGLAKIAEQYLKKGDSVFIEGKIKTEKWVDKEGNNRRTTKIRATNMTMLSKAGSGGGGNSGAQESSGQYKSGGSSAPVDQNSGSNDIDDLPF